MDKKSKKNLIIRVVVYSTLIMAVVFLIWFSVTAPPRGHKIWMKIQGIEFCETPQEAIKLYANALIRGDRKEALIYIYKPKYEYKLWDGAKKRLYKKTNKELKTEGEDILNNGYMEKEDSYSAEWKIIHNIDGKIIGGSMRIINTGYDGWKIN